MGQELDQKRRRDRVSQLALFFQISGLERVIPGCRRFPANSPTLKLMELGESLTRWTVRLAMALYVVSLALRWSARCRRPWLGRPWLGMARLAWTGGCILFLAHVACAFNFFHGWSHAAAYQHTARRTEETIGIFWGGGLYLNYAFTLVWLADVLWWWRGLEQYERRGRAVEWGVQAFLAFMAFNGTVVF